ncbi:MAG: class I SAM-dependent methyltransferase [Clostridia bacterium]|nr:class I SAM-dependent methyltransferase [Clostridia bacterium]
MDWKETTLHYYDVDPDRYIRTALQADMSETRSRFTKHLPAHAQILDFGCGSGRDTKAFLEERFQVEAIDGSEELCKKASAYTGIQVEQMLFNDLNETDKYDGIWANATLLHLPKAELKDVLQKLEKALKPNGILFASFKYGTFEGIRTERYYTDFTKDTLNEFWAASTSLKIFDEWITDDTIPGREGLQWINILARRE